jgi:hypothetical protein
MQSGNTIDQRQTNAAALPGSARNPIEAVEDAMTL